MIIPLTKEFLAHLSNQRRKFEEFLLANEGKKIEVKIYSPTRSGNQNNYYWAYLAIIEAETGNDANSLHEYYRRILLKPEFIEVNRKEGKVQVKIPRSTTSLTKTEFSDYLDKISADCGVELPNPEDSGYISNSGTYGV